MTPQCCIGEYVVIPAHKRGAIPARFRFEGTCRTKPVPVIVTGVPTGPDVELSKMVGVTVDLTVNVIEGELVPSVPITVCSFSETVEKVH